MQFLGVDTAESEDGITPIGGDDRDSPTEVETTRPTQVLGFAGARVRARGIGRPPSVRLPRLDDSSWRKLALPADLPIGEGR